MAFRTMNSGRNQPQAVHAGTNTAVYRMSASLTVSVGDSWIIGKIPHGAIPVGAVFYAAAQLVGKFGTSASLSLFFASATYSIALANSTKRLGTAFQISVSDDAAVRYENVCFTTSGVGATLGYLGDLCVQYVMPGQTL